MRDLVLSCVFFLVCNSGCVTLIPCDSLRERQVRDLHLLGISPDPFLHCMACIDLAMPPDHNMVLNEAVEVPSWMDASFGQVLQ